MIHRSVDRVAAGGVASKKKGRIRKGKEKKFRLVPLVDFRCPFGMQAIERKICPLSDPKTQPAVPSHLTLNNLA